MSVVFVNCSLFTGVDGAVIPAGEVWVDGRHVRAAGPPGTTAGAPAEVPRVDLGGRFVMPGMTESHAHLSYSNSGPTGIGADGPEAATIHAVDNARLMLASGFTAAISFGSVHGVDVALRDAINRGQVVGPRVWAAGRDLGGTASNADTAYELGSIVDGPWEVRRAVRAIRKTGADVVKIFLDGELLSRHAPPGELSYRDDEVAAAVDEAHARGMRAVCHARSAAAVKQAVRAGMDIVGHANYLDDEAVDLLRAERHRIFVGPAIAWEMAFVARCEEIGFSRDFVRAKGYDREVDETVVSVKRLRDAGVRVLIGGDYGLNITPHGTYAKDLEHFVDLFGMTPNDALLCATRDGGAAADPEGMIGTLEDGKHADLVIVDGDPTADVRVLQDHDRILGVMKGGQLWQGLHRDRSVAPIQLMTERPPS
jgi:imidazolonepropionase-like amidohydrolase